MPPATVPRPDAPSLVAGLALVAVGIVLLLDQRGTLDLSFGALAPLLTATTGAALVALGLSRRA